MRRYGGGILYAALPLHMQRGCFRRCIFKLLVYFYFYFLNVDLSLRIQNLLFVIYHVLDQSLSFQDTFNE